MLNLIKYELRGNFATLLGICLIVIIGDLFLLTKVGSWEVGVPVLSSFLGFGALLLIFISSLTIMSNYLYNEQGYLLFTLPQSGKSILASRLVTAVIQFAIVTLVSAVMFFLNDQEKIWNAIVRHVEFTEGLYSIVMYLWTIIYELTFIYFCMVVGKIAFKGKKLGKMGSFILFIFFSIGRNGLSVIIANFFPDVVQLNSFITLNLNIGELMLDIIIFITLFMSTAYLLEHKVDL